MKKLLFAIAIITFVSVGAANAQKQAQPDNNQFITVVQTVGTNHQTHYTLTNKNSVAMDFTLYKQVSNGSWDITHHLNLNPGETYEDVNSFTGLTGKYVVYSAPHSDWASFPSSFDMAKLQAGTAAPQTATAPTPGAPTQPAPAPAPATNAPNPSTNKNSVPAPVVPPL